MKLYPARPCIASSYFLSPAFLHFSSSSCLSSLRRIWVTLSSPRFLTEGFIPRAELRRCSCARRDAADSLFQFDDTRGPKTGNERRSLWANVSPRCLLSVRRVNSLLRFVRAFVSTLSAWIWRTADRDDCINPLWCTRTIEITCLRATYNFLVARV